ncbi:uncharacterized protein DUF4265 [Pontibacter virosus]|uniref:Uncharacterized protein DUF4265 n=2 Tax=Pontibacter virosus TaxID=1765052 RepID=A0A2U1AV11_9BACT|nr:uncharacterized protein DUF4265 [Pontibacter virosus]
MAKPSPLCVIISMKKIVFKFWNDILDEDYVEGVWAETVDEEKGHYKIDNIPFFVTSYSVGDIVQVEEEYEELVVKDLVEPSENSTLNIKFSKGADKDETLEKLVSYGCNYESMENLIPGYYSVNVPSSVSYQPVYKFLKELEIREQLGFREACLCHNREEQ